MNYLKCNASFATKKSSRSDVLYKKGAFKNFAKFTGKQQCQSVSSGLTPATLLKKRLTQMFSCEFCKSFKNILFMKHLLWLLMHKQKQFSLSFVFILYNFWSMGFPFHWKKHPITIFMQVIHRIIFFRSQENCASLLNLSYAKCGVFFWIKPLPTKSPNSSIKKPASFWGTIRNLPILSDQ